MYREHIGRALDYIEAHLGGELPLAALAAAAGYSEYHFLRIFREAAGLTPADYIRKRRLSEIAKELAASDAPILGTALKWGYRSPESFLRAFRAEHGVLPSEYRRSANSLLLCERLRFEPAPLALMPELVRLAPFSVVAYPIDEPTPPKFWNKYNCKKLSRRLTGGAVTEDYGVWWPRGEGWYFCGVPETLALGDRTGAIELAVPGGLYAVFLTPPASHATFVSTIHRTWAHIAETWLPRSGYVRRPGPEFETYLEDSRIFREKIHIPVDQANGERPQTPIKAQ